MAHMGGWNCYDEVEDLIAGIDVYLDTAFTINPIEKKSGQGLSEYNDVQLSMERFVSLVHLHSSKKILFGSDSPWSDQAHFIELIKNSGLNGDELEDILGGNAAKLLGL